MEPSRPRFGLPSILDALCRDEDDSAVERLIADFGGNPAHVTARSFGEPAVRSRRLRFGSGGEIIVHDGAVVAVLLHLRDGSRPIELSAWISGVTNAATLDDLAKSLGSAPRFAGFKEPFFAVDGGYLRAEFAEPGGWKAPGNLTTITVTVEQPGISCRPEDDDCPNCSALLVRADGPASADGPVDVDATVRSLAAARDAGHLEEDSRWVPLDDLQALQASGLMQHVESQLTCTRCRRILCLTLYRTSAPTLGYFALNDAIRRPLEAIPPVTLWGDAARVAKDNEAMHYLDHAPGSWFLVEQQGALYLQVRYVISSMAEDSAFIELDEKEREEYRAGGRDYVIALARRIEQSHPHLEDSSYFLRDLYRGDQRSEYGPLVDAAIVNHTWIAEQRRKRL
ncbi:hypothetical protein [Humidisolicoccus flavus]|uniref:hypothetical protein n=1 Tax=Humidisolicoccus flavus TaxID=3111414 RepID=UPI003252C2E9